MADNALITLAAKIKAQFSKIGHTHTAEYEPKNSNIQMHVTTTGNPHSTSKTDIGLGNVTNDAQMKKQPSSTNGNIPTWNGTSGDALGAGYTVDTTLSSLGTAIPTSQAVHTAIGNATLGLSGETKPGVADITALKAINTTSASDYGDKVMIMVENSGLYRIDRDSSAAADDNFIVAPTTGVGRWIKIAGSTTEHNLTMNSQGGATNEKYHLSAAQYGAIPAGATGTNKMITADDVKLSKLTATGLLNIDNVEVTAAQWTAFDNALA